jgi:sterol desaturase/sphingolipid hydroxylase (fatty acid hydroxylase superfamily)
MPDFIVSVAPPWLLTLLPLLFLGLIGAAALEGAVLSWRAPGSYDWKEFASTLGDIALRRAVTVAGTALGLAAVAPALRWAHEHRLATIELDGAVTILALFVGTELCYYAFHRASHRVRWFWASHAVHHSPNQLTLATSARLGFTGRYTGLAIFFAPLVWVGFSPPAVLAALALNLLYQFWIHAAWIPRLPAPIEWLFNTPSHHRVHHASNREYLDCNYGGVLIVFDRLFGSFVEERADLVPRYGLTTPLASYNPLAVALHGWVAIGRDLAAARGWRARLAVLIGPPGERPGEGPGGGPR